MDAPEQGVAEGAPELLKKEMPLHRHAEKLLAQNGVSKDDPDYHHHLGNTIKHLRQFGNIDLINKQGVAEAETLARYRDRLGTTGNLQSQNDRHQDSQQRRHERNQDWLDANHQSSLNRFSDRDKMDAARTQHEIDVLAHRLNRMQRDDDDWEKTFDMMRDRINRYQWSSQRDVNPEQLAAISNIKYEPKNESAQAKTNDELLAYYAQRKAEKQKQQQGVAEGGPYGSRNPDTMSPNDYDRYQQDQMDQSKRDFKRREMDHELGHERNNYAVAIDGRTWKVFADQRQAQNIARSLKAKGKNATVHVTGANPTMESKISGILKGINA